MGGLSPVLSSACTYNCVEANATPAPATFNQPRRDICWQELDPVIEVFSNRNMKQIGVPGSLPRELVLRKPTRPSSCLYFRAGWQVPSYMFELGGDLSPKKELFFVPLVIQL